MSAQLDIDTQKGVINCAIFSMILSSYTRIKVFHFFGIPCEPPSDEAKVGEVKRALSERVARVAQRPIWLRSAGDPEL